MWPFLSHIRKTWTIWSLLLNWPVLLLVCPVLFDFLYYLKVPLFIVVVIWLYIPDLVGLPAFVSEPHFHSLDGVSSPQTFLGYFAIVTFWSLTAFPFALITTAIRNQILVTRAERETR